MHVGNLDGLKPNGGGGGGGGEQVSVVGWGDDLNVVLWLSSMGVLDPRVGLWIGPDAPVDGTVAVGVRLFARCVCSGLPWAGCVLRLLRSVPIAFPVVSEADPV